MLALAEQRRQAGKLAEAEMLARRVLDAEPGNAEAFHLLGIIAHQSGNLAHAIEHVKRATQLAPSVALYHANLGEMCRLAKRTDEAIAEGERALALQPDYADALSNLGIAHYEKDDFDAAIRSYERAIALKPNFAQAHSNLGNALRACKRYEEALPHYRRSLELKPQFADAWNNLGTTLRDLKRNEEAEDAYRKALALKADDPDMLNNLALALKDLNRLDEAEATLRRSLAIETRNEKTLLYLGTVLLDRHQPDEAAATLEQALALNAANHDVHNMMGRVAFERSDLDGALRHHRRALELKPDLADALNNMGNVLKELGKLDEAREAYLKALALDPSVTGVYVNYADSVKFTPDNPHLKTMETMRAGAVPLSDADRLQLDFALAKAYADLKDHRRSFERLLSGNALKRAQIQYDEPAALALFDRIEAVFTARTSAQQGKARRRRSLAGADFRHGHAALRHHAGRADSGQPSAGPRRRRAQELQRRGQRGARARWPDHPPSRVRSGARRDGHREDRRALPRRDPQTCTPGAIHHRQDAVELLFRRPHPSGVLPNAKIIHTMRDPVDTCVSCFSKLFTAEQNHTYDLGELGRYYRRYRQLMDHWRRVLPPGRILDVRYEDVVADLDTQARRIISHCGLAWDDRCLSFHETDRPVRTASATQVRQPIYKSAVGRWRVYEEFLGPLLTELDLAGAGVANGGAGR